MGYEPELDLPLGVLMGGRGVDQVVHAIVNLVSLGVHDGDQRSQGPQAARPFVSGLVGIGRSGHLADGLQDVGTQIENGNDAALPGIGRVMQDSHNVVEQGGIEGLASMLGVVLFGEEPVDIDDLGGGKARAGMKFG